MFVRDGVNFENWERFNEFFLLKNHNFKQKSPSSAPLKLIIALPFFEKVFFSNSLSYPEEPVTLILYVGLAFGEPLASMMKGGLKFAHSAAAWSELVCFFCRAPWRYYQGWFFFSEYHGFGFRFGLLLADVLVRLIVNWSHICRPKFEHFVLAGCFFYIWNLNSYFLKKKRCYETTSVNSFNL